MDRRVLAFAWGVLGAAIALSALPEVSGGARLVVGAASVLGPLAAFASAWAPRRRAGVLLVVSAVVTPTYFAYVLNLVPLVAGVVLLVRSGRAPLARPRPGAWRRSPRRPGPSATPG